MAVGGILPSGRVFARVGSAKSWHPDLALAGVAVTEKDQTQDV